jgi:hypothetical protein
MKLASLKKLFLFGARQERLHKCFCWLTVFNVEDRDVDKYDLFYWFKSGLVCKERKAATMYGVILRRFLKEKKAHSTVLNKIGFSGINSINLC